jgi:hypothetical protein
MIALSESERVETLRVLLENKCAAAAARRLRLPDWSPPVLRIRKASHGAGPEVFWVLILPLIRACRYGCSG